MMPAAVGLFEKHNVQFVLAALGSKKRIESGHRLCDVLLSWCALHDRELLENWESAKLHGELHRIDPLA
jgi:hypothetical protein